MDSNVDEPTTILDCNVGDITLLAKWVSCPWKFGLAREFFVSINASSWWNWLGVKERGF